MAESSDLEIKDTSGLTDADWTEINKIRKAYREGGTKALNNALAALAHDPIRYITVAGAFFPDEVREAIRDDMAANGMTEEDVRELVRKLEGSERKH